MTGTPGAKCAFDVAYPRSMREKEAALVARRRQVAAVPAPSAAGAKGIDPIGVALSGGGIRSATFALGFFQGLARLDLVKRVDFLSTVSGGGYFGAFLGGLFARRTEAKPGEAQAKVRSVLLVEEDQWVLGNLRENGRYLAPNGTADSFLGLAIILRNLFSLQIVLVATLFAAALLFVCALDDWVYVGFGRSVAWYFGGGALLHLYDHPWVSTWAIVPLLLLVGALVPLGWAYWLPERKRYLIWVLPSLVTALGAVVLIVSGGPAARCLLTVGVLTFGWLLVAWLRGMRRAKSIGKKGPPPEDDPTLRGRAIRSALTRWLSFFVMWTIVALALALVDSAALALRDLSLPVREILGGILAAGTTVAAFGKKLAVVFGGNVGGKRLRLSQSLLAGVAAIVLVVAYFVAVDVFARDLWTWAYRASAPVAWWVIMLAGVAVAAVLGQGWPFVNRSSQHQFYSERLTRAYLGASNPRRSGGTGGVTHVVPGDDIPMSRYWRTPAPSDAPVANAEESQPVSPPERGGPLHLVNVTVNETFGGRSNLEMRDAKGLGMAVGPAGMSVGVRNHAVGAWDEAGARETPATLEPHSGSPNYSVFGGRQLVPLPLSRLEALSLGRWVGISGAAFSTGLGARTSFGLAMLCGLANVRLGYWWAPGVERFPFGMRLLAWFPVQWHLVNEMLARFPGTSREHWYLSDGGHFENMGAYELIRRRLRKIVIVDAEADPAYTFEGIANLVRKARLDFGAEIDFLSAKELDRFVDPACRRQFGPLDELARDGKPGDPDFEAKRQKPSKARAAIAIVRYAAGDSGEGDAAADGLILYVKTAVLGDETADVLRYQSAHPTFPHESTADQFFDEAQWESYRQLGKHTALSLFDGEGSAQGESVWNPKSVFFAGRRLPMDPIEED